VAFMKFFKQVRSDHLPQRSLSSCLPPRWERLIFTMSSQAPFPPCQFQCIFSFPLLLTGCSHVHQQSCTFGGLFLCLIAGLNVSMMDVSFLRPFCLPFPCFYDTSPLPVWGTLSPRTLGSIVGLHFPPPDFPRKPPPRRVRLPFSYFFDMPLLTPDPSDLPRMTRASSAPPLKCIIFPQDGQPHFPFFSPFPGIASGGPPWVS